MQRPCSAWLPSLQYVIVRLYRASSPQRSERDRGRGRCVTRWPSYSPGPAPSAGGRLMGSSRCSGRPSFAGRAEQAAGACGVTPGPFTPDRYRPGLLDPLAHPLSLSFTPGVSSAEQRRLRRHRALLDPFYLKHPAETLPPRERGSPAADAVCPAPRTSPSAHTPPLKKERRPTCF